MSFKNMPFHTVVTNLSFVQLHFTILSSDLVTQQIKIDKPLLKHVSQLFYTHVRLGLAKQHNHHLKKACLQSYTL